MRYWWVNQNQTYKFEVPGGFLWSPKRNQNGARNHFYDTMAEVSPGDVVFSFCDTYIKAIGVVQRPAITSPKPDFRTAGSNWSNEGWFVEVEFEEIVDPIRPKDFMVSIAPLLEERYAPLQRNGDGLQGVYLTEISSRFGELLIILSNADLPIIENELRPPPVTESEYEIQLEIEARHLEGDLEKIQITKARRGQGIFKVNVRLVETQCRVTGVTNVRHLRASHIKPWAASDNHEKLDGYNGLLLSPHVDHLFDRGFISFENSGGIIVSPQLSPDVLSRWSIPVSQNVGSFSQHQASYLEYHRDVILQS
jgi:putative restriction endonuclease